MKKLILYSFICALGFYSIAGLNAEAAPLQLTAAQQKSIKAFVGYFDTIVFGSEYDKKQAATIVYKWQGPVRLHLRYVGVKANPKHRHFINQHIVDLRRLTRLPIVIVGNPKVATIDIIFVKRKDMGKLKLPQASPQYIAKLAAPGGCYFISYKLGPRKKQKGRIQKSVIVVNAERDIAGINHCLLEELTQSIGFPNDSDTMRPSVFSDKDQLFEFSPVDKTVIRVLYDKRMKMGIPRKEGLALAGEIMADVFFKNEKPATSHKPKK